MIVVKKYFASSEFDRMEAGLVIDGSNLDPKLYLDKSLPTVTIHSVSPKLARIPVCLSWVTITKIDIKAEIFQLHCTMI
jgi:hypothetical protein